MKILLTSTYNKTSFDQKGFLIISPEYYEHFLNRVDAAFKTLETFNQAAPRPARLIIPGMHDCQDAHFLTKEEYLGYLNPQEISEDEAQTIYKLFNITETLMEPYGDSCFGEVLGWYMMTQDTDWLERFQNGW